MADYSAKERVGWQSGEVEIQDDDGNWVRIGEIPEHVKQILNLTAS